MSSILLKISLEKSVTLSLTPRVKLQTHWKKYISAEKSLVSWNVYINIGCPPVGHSHCIYMDISILIMIRLSKFSVYWFVHVNIIPGIRPYPGFKKPGFAVWRNPKGILAVTRTSYFWNNDETEICLSIIKELFIMRSLGMRKVRNADLLKSVAISHRLTYVQCSISAV